tara:strand:+ start:1492 stop:1758 length:267 start_codon:yes stop_codon:yes gene_type:complete
MAFTERQEFKLEIIPPYYIIQCRRSDIVEKDGVEVGRQYNRMMHRPGDDMSNACSEAQAVASVLWTQQVIDDFQSLREQQPATTPEVE